MVDALILLVSIPAYFCYTSYCVGTGLGFAEREKEVNLSNRDISKARGLV